MLFIFVSSESARSRRVGVFFSSTGK
jgi:hypothetical protein